MTQVKYGMNLIQTDANKIVLIGGITDSGYSNEVEVFDPSKSKYTRLDTPIDASINGSMMAIKLDACILVITQNANFISNRITSAPTPSPTLSPTIDSSERISSVGAYSTVYMIAMLTAILMITCGVISYLLQ